MAKLSDSKLSDSKASDSKSSVRDGYTEAETRIITDVFGFVHNKDPDGRVQKALENWLGVEVKLEVLSAMIEGPTVEAEVHLGEAKVYLKLQATEEGEGDWIEKYQVEEVRTPCSPKILKSCAKMLKKSDLEFDKIYAATSSDSMRKAAAQRSAKAALSPAEAEATATASESWHVLVGQKKDLFCVSLTSVKGEITADLGVFEEDARRRLASQLIAQTGRALAQQMGSEAEMELFAKIKTRKSSALSRREEPDVVNSNAPAVECFIAYGIFADVSVAVCFSANGTVQIKVES